MRQDKTLLTSSPQRCPGSPPRVSRPPPHRRTDRQPPAASRHVVDGHRAAAGRRATAGRRASDRTAGLRGARANEHGHEASEAVGRAAGPGDVKLDMTLELQFSL